MLKEFKEFALKGNLVDTAIAFVMGAAFGKVSSAFIDGMIMPLVGMIQGKDFSSLYIGLNEATKAASAAGIPLAKAKEVGPVMAYGDFISVAIQFVIVAFVMFMIIKALNKMKNEAPAEAPAPSASEALLSEILTELKKGK
jgi:large conductance mechanosensitive channel